MTILIADDDTSSRIILNSALLKDNHEVIMAEDGREAWEIFQRKDIRMLISDWMMPHIDGLELCRKVRTANRSYYTYVILVTVLSGKGNFLDGMDAGVDDFMIKPIDIDQLAARIRVAERILSLQKEVNQLQSLLPICSYCKKIRHEDERTWSEVDDYIARRTSTKFSHGICPKCYVDIVQPELDSMEQHRNRS